MEYFDWQFNEDTGGIWTGRLDMYGNKIYECDKVKTPIGTGIVRYNPKYWRFEIAFDEEPLETKRLPAGIPEKCWEVIDDNKYEIMAKVDFTEKELVDNAKELYNSIEEYTWKLIQARLHKDLEAEEYVIFQRETLLCRVQQYLSNIIDYYDGTRSDTDS